ncbi:MAG: hypothetical protein KDC07_06265, partial [Chitinophagaceae bacterium]|nr:hypothetical protein [Chitinophagaceae bacterium]
MKHILLTGLLIAALGHVDSYAQGKKVVDDIYYTADDAAKDADEAAKERDAIDAARRKRAEERQANNTADGDQGEGTYIDYDDDDYNYATRINRFYNPYFGASYWAYSPSFWYNPWYGGGYYGSSWGFGYGWGMGYGYYGNPYWGYGFGYPGYYSGWYSPYWGYGGYGYGGYYGGYYNGFYNGYYAGAYDNGSKSYSNRSYGPRSSINRYPGSLRASGRSTTGYGSRGQLREANAGTSANRNYSGRYIAPSSSSSANERRSISNSERGSSNIGRSYSNTNERGSGSRSERYGSPSQGSRSESQRSNYGYNRPSSEPSNNYSQPSQQRSEPSYNSTPSRSY